MDDTSTSESVTRDGHTAVESTPAGPERKREFLGDMIRTAEIVGDIISPAIDLEEIEACRD